MKHDPDLRIDELGLILPPAPRPVGIYKPVLVVDKFLICIRTGTAKN